jgi:putative ABC transport system ATP-binding protein
MGNQGQAADTLLRVESLSKNVQFQGQTLAILHAQSFTLQEGESLAIVGASGSGKSTLLGLLAGLDLPSTGSVTIDGVCITDLDEDQRAAMRAQNVGFVFQQFQLSALSALENIMLPLELAGFKNARERAAKMLARVGLGDRAQHFPATLSGGEQQRVALARAFVTQPKILFADEPTGSLDHATGAQIEALMFEMNQQQQTTLVLVTHDARLAARCDRQLHLHAGFYQATSPR